MFRIDKTKTGEMLDNLMGTLCELVNDNSDHLTPEEYVRGLKEMYTNVITGLLKSNTLSTIVSELETAKAFIVENETREEITNKIKGQLAAAHRIVEMLESILAGKFGETIDAENTVCIPASEYRFVVVGKVAEMLTHELTKWEEVCDDETVTGLKHERAEMYALAYKDTLERLHMEYTIDNVEKVLENIKHDYEYYCGKQEERSFGMHIPSTRDALKECACLIEHMLNTQK